MNYETTARVSVAELALADGETHTFTDFSTAGPCAVAIHPSAGATVTVSISLSRPSRVKAGQALFVPAGVGIAGVVSTPDGFEALAPVTALRFECTGGTAVVEVAQ